MPYMSGRKLTPTQYAHQQIINTIGDEVFFSNEQHLICTSQELSYLAQVMQDIGYEVHQHITTGLLPVEESSKERH